MARPRGTRQAAKAAQGAGSPGQSIADQYSPAGNKAPWWKRALRVAAWALFVAAVSAAIAALVVLSGGAAALPAGVTMAQAAAAAAGSAATQGLLEGLIYGTVFEVMGDRRAAKALAAAMPTTARAHAAKPITVDQLDREIRELQALRAGVAGGGRQDG